MKSTVPRVGIIDNKRAELLEEVALLSLTFFYFYFLYFFINILGFPKGRGLSRGFPCVGVEQVILTALDKTRGSLNIFRPNSSIPRTYE